MKRRLLSPMNVHPGKFICDELVQRQWTTTRLIAEGGGDGIDLLALEMFLCGGDKNLRLDDDTIEVIAKGFAVAPDLFRNLQKQWLSSPLPSAPYELPDSILADEAGSKQTDCTGETK